MLQLNSKNIPYQSVQVFLSLVSKSSDIANIALKGAHDVVIVVSKGIGKITHFIVKKAFIIVV